MQRPAHEVIVHGAVGGLLAGAIVALWFFVVDLGADAPLRTPTALAAALLHRDIAAPDFRIAWTYSVLHFGLFTLFGIATAWFLTITKTAPGLLLGVVFGLGVLDAVHYGGLLLTGAQVLTVLPVFHVLASNLIAGVSLMLYLHRGFRTERPLGFAALKGRPLLAHGAITGLFGAGAVAAFFFGIDVVTGRPFYTPAALGTAVFLGAAQPQAVEIHAGLVLAYTILHVVAFGLVGIGFVWIAERIENAPGLWLLAVMGFAILEALFVGTLGLLTDWVMGALGLWEVALGNLVAVVAMGLWVWRTHPRLRERLLREAVRTQV